MFEKRSLADREPSDNRENRFLTVSPMPREFVCNAKRICLHCQENLSAMPRESVWKEIVQKGL